MLERAEIADNFGKFRFFDVIKRLDDTDLPFLVVERFCNPHIDLSPASVSNADMGEIYEELIRRPLYDGDGNPVRTPRGKLVPDKEKNDTENIPLTQSVEEYMAREVYPYAPDAWIEPRKQKRGQLLELRDGGVVGYEIPFTRHFYECTPLRHSAEILAEIRELEASVASRLEGILR